MKRLAALAALVVAVLAVVLSAGGGVPQSAGGSVHPPGWGKPAPKTYSLAQSGPTATMFDSVNLATIPANPFAVAGYTSGHWPTYLPMVRAYPHAHVLSIAIAARWHAFCLDVEPGDANPSEAAGFVRADIAAGFPKPCIYSSYWEFVNQVRPALAAAGIARSAVWEWDASYTGRPGITPSFDATQFTDKALGRNLDESTVSLAFLGVNPPPLPRCIHHRMTRAACAAAKARIASDERALAASWRAFDVARHDLTVNACRRPYRRSVCRSAGRGSALFTHRIRFFAAAVNTLQEAS